MAEKLNRLDMRLVGNYLREQGATSVRIEAVVQHPRLSEMLVDPRARQLLLGTESQLKVLHEFQLGTATERLIEITIQLK